MTEHKIDADALRAIADDPELIEVARRKIEDVLIEFRDSRISQALRNNGLVVYERNGQASDIIRLSNAEAVSIGMKAIAAHLEAKTP